MINNDFKKCSTMKGATFVKNWIKIKAKTYRPVSYLKKQSSGYGGLCVERVLYGGFECCSLPARSWGGGGEVCEGGDIFVDSIFSRVCRVFFAPRQELPFVSTIIDHFHPNIQCS